MKKKQQTRLTGAAIVLLLAFLVPAGKGLCKKEQARFGDPGITAVSGVNPSNASDCDESGSSVKVKKSVQPVQPDNQNAVSDSQKLKNRNGIAEGKPTLLKKSWMGSLWRQLTPSTEKTADSSNTLQDRPYKDQWNLDQMFFSLIM